MRPVRGVARALLGSAFITAGSRAVLSPDKYADQLAPVADRFAPTLRRISPQLPTEAVSLVRVNGAVQVAAGAMLATGTAPRPAAAVLAGTLIPSTLISHPFWQIKDPELRRLERGNFLKNLGLLGGLLLAAVDTAGSPSLGWRTQYAWRQAHQAGERAALKARKAVSPAG
jgi:putative oxidoreductase